MISASLVLISLLFAIYIWLCGIGTGAALLRLLSSSTLTKRGLQLATPAWELSNVFLVLCFAGLVALFPHGLATALRAVKTSLIIGAAALVIRFVLTLYLFRYKTRTGFNELNLLLVAASLVVPLSLGSAGVYLLTGQDFWRTHVGWLLMGSLGLGLLALAVNFVYFMVGLTPRARVRDIARWLAAAFAIFTVVLLQRALVHSSSHLLSLALVLFMLLVSFLVLWQVGLWYSGQERYLWYYLSSVALTGPTLLALANRPYLLFSTLTLPAAYSTGAHNQAILVCLSVVSLLMVIGFGLLVWRLLQIPKTKPAKSKPKKKTKLSSGAMPVG